MKPFSHGFHLPLLHQVEIICERPQIAPNIINSSLILVTFKSIQSVPFPSVTVCAPNSGKWQALVDALNHYDYDDLIFDVLKNTTGIREYLKGPFHDKKFWEIFSKKFEPKLQLNHALPERLKLLPVEEEVFYILHFALYALELTNTDAWDEAIRDLNLGKTNRHQAAIDIKENLCKKVIDCTAQYTTCCTAINITSTKDIPTWKDCNGNNTNSMHQNWCKDCADLSECIFPNWDDYFIRIIVNTFFTWRKYHNKRNIIDAAISTYLYEKKYELHGLPPDDFDHEISKYIKTFNAFPEKNLTLLDAWAYTNLEVIKDIDLFLGDDTSVPITALKNCINSQNKESCLLVKGFSKEMEFDDKKIWETIYKTIYDGLIPLCSYASENNILQKCNNFKKLNNGKCFTFNESSFDHILGQTHGLNFVANYNYPGTNADLSDPITIMLHESSQKPDIENIMGDNFRAAPGRIIDLKISATVIDTTESFDAMNFNSRKCEKDMKNGEMNCISDAIIERAAQNCGCQPWYLSNPKFKACDTLGMICYEKEFANGTKDTNLKGSCYESCKNVKYNLVVLENAPIDKTLNVDKYGQEFRNFVFNPERLYSYLELEDPELDGDFMERRLKRMQSERMSIFHVNFEQSKVLTVIKDAKITLPDMIGNIGGTLGVFIGLSFLGLLDTFIEWIQYLHQKIKV